MILNQAGRSSFRRATLGFISALICIVLIPRAVLPQTAAPNLNFDTAIEHAESMPRLYSLLVSHDGQLVLEHYFNGKCRNDIANVKSVSKSIMSALVGIAIEQGHIHAVDQPIGEYFGKQLSGAADTAKNGITVEDLLTMRSGLETTSNRNYGAWVLSSNWINFALQQPLERPPGTRMQYSTGNTHLLSAILSQTTGQNTLQFAREALGRPLGFHLAAWPRDPQGIYFGSPPYCFSGEEGRGSISPPLKPNEPTIILSICLHPIYYK